MIPYGIILIIGIAICLLAGAIVHMEIKYTKQIKDMQRRLDAMSAREG